MSGELRYLAEQLRRDDLAVARVWRDDTRSFFKRRYFEPGINVIEDYLVAREQLIDAIDEAEAIAARL
jgi:hypothetical protein